MLDVTTKNRINTARDILVGKVPDPKSQVEQITIALIYKFMDDMDVESEELGGKRTFFTGEFSKYAWRKIFDPRQSGYDLLNLYSEAIGKMDTNPAVPKLFRDIFKNAYLPYRDPETLKSFLKIINDFEYSHSEKLGDAFEYLLSVLGSQGDAGQFRTPRHIIDFMVAIIDPKKNETILDPACGTAGFLISSYKHIIKNNSSNYVPESQNNPEGENGQSGGENIITVNGYTGDKLSPGDRKILAGNMYGYDISPDMVRLSLVNMYLHGIKEPKIFEYDSLTSEDNWNQYFDVILANPPFMSPKGGIRPHKRFSVQSNRSEVLFVDYIAEHLTQAGRAAIIVPEGIIFQSGKAYKQLRKMLVENYLVGVVSLPAGVFNPYSGVKTSILWLDKALARKTDKILFVKIENDGYDLGSQRRPIKMNDLPAVYNQIIGYIDNQSFGIDDNQLSNTHFVTKIEILHNEDCILSRERYSHALSVSSSFELTPCGLHMKQNVKSFDPRNAPQDIYELWSIPAYDKGTPEIVKGEEIGSSKKVVYPGDVLLSRIVPHIRRTWVVRDTGTSYTKLASTEWIVFNSEKYKPEFLARILRSDMFHGQFMHTVTGVGGSLSRANPKAVADIKIPLPPLAVQINIVEEIDRYQNQLTECETQISELKLKINSRITKVWSE